MAGKKKSPLWRKVFLRALARTGNARASAVEAGVDVGTAYDHRIKDGAFLAQWAGALATFTARPPGRGGKAGKAGEMVLRRTQHGDKLVRAAPGRWCARVEETFFDGLEETGCVRAAAAAAGISTNALYARRKAYPEFAERWDEIGARAGKQLPTLLHTAAVVSLGANPSTGSGQRPRRGRGRLPKVNVDQAIRISRIKGPGGSAGADARDCNGRLRATEEELNEAILKKLDVLHKRLIKKGWIETDHGSLIPPGWAFVGTEEDREAERDAEAEAEAEAEGEREEDGDSNA
jgi:hypothetical protein